jgi:hypothetical protein
MLNKTLGRVIIALVYLGVAFSAGLAAETPPSITVEAIGSGQIYRGDTAKARKRAIKNGLIAAIYQGTNELLPQETVVGAFGQLNHLIYAQVDQHIENYKVIAESSRAGRYYVLVEAKVSLALIERALKEAGVIRAQQGLPSVLLLLTQTRGEPQGGDPEQVGFHKQASKIIEDILQQNSFPLIDPASYGADPLPPELDLQKALAMGARFKADVVVIGTVFVQPGPISANGALQSVQGQVDLKGHATATGEVLASVSRVEVAPNYSSSLSDTDKTGAHKAVADASAVAGRELADSLSATWQASSQATHSIEVVVEGASQMLTFVRFRRSLSDVPKVKSVQTREMQLDKSTLIVKYQGTAKELADALDGKTFDTYRVKIHEVTTTQLKVGLFTL